MVAPSHPQSDPAMPSTPTIAAIRFGTGLRPRQAGPAPAPLDAAALLGDLTAPDRMPARFPVLTRAEAEALAGQVRPARRAAEAGTKAGDPAPELAYRALRQRLRLATNRGAQMTIARAVEAPVGFAERLVQFWGDHFATRARNAEMGPMAQVFAEEAIRPHLAGRFPDMLKAAATHPMLMVYLDQTASVGPNSPAGRKRGGLNENLAREMLELHTLGVGGSYAQADVRQLALLLTGLSFTYRAGWHFDATKAEPGAELVLGERYGGAVPADVSEIHAALEDLALHPETGRHLARKLAVHFTSDDPDPGMVDAMAAAYAAGGGALLPVYAAMLEHPAAWDSFGAKARQPLDFLVAALRALGVSGAQVAALAQGPVNNQLLGPLRLMGQPFAAPPGPDGWPEEAADWINPQGLAARIEWAMKGPRLWAKPLPDPRRLLRAALDDAAGERLAWAVGRAENAAEGTGLILASPDFNRR